MAKKQEKRCSASLVTREMQIKTTIRYYYILNIRMSSIKEIESPKGIEKMRIWHTTDENVERCNHFVKQSESGKFLKCST